MRLLLLMVEIQLTSGLELPVSSSWINISEFQGLHGVPCVICISKKQRKIANQKRDFPIYIYIQRRSKILILILLCHKLPTYVIMCLLMCRLEDGHSCQADPTG